MVDGGKICKCIDFLIDFISPFHALLKVKEERKKEK
jgi:hypothetical protein